MKKILFMPLVCVSMLTVGQTITVRDNSTREPIPNVSIKDKNNSAVTTDNRGKADITSLDRSDSLIVSHLSYGSLKIKSSGNVEVNLSAKAIMLDELVFSANRTAE